MAVAEPMLVLREAIKAVPAVKYALAVAGVAAVLAIVKLFGLDYQVAAFGTVVVLFLMVALVLFAKLTALRPADFRLPSLVFTWACLILLIGTVSLLFTSAFFAWPKNFVKQAESGVVEVPRTEASNTQPAPAGRGQAAPPQHSPTAPTETPAPAPSPPAGPESTADTPGPLKTVFDEIKGAKFKGTALGKIPGPGRNCANGQLDRSEVTVEFTSFAPMPMKELDNISGSWTATEFCNQDVIRTEIRSLQIQQENTGLTGYAFLASCEMAGQACSDAPQSTTMALSVRGPHEINLDGIPLLR